MSVPLLDFLAGMDNNDALLNVINTNYPAAQPYQAPQFVTADILIKIMPGTKPDFAQQLADIFNDVAPTYGLNSPAVFPEYIAECAHECENFMHFEEDLNYSAQALANTWPNRYAVVPHASVKVPNDLAWKLNRNPQAIANNCYASRMGNGNEASGDGWRFRGGGGLQMTGHDMYMLYMKYKNRTDLANVAEEIRTDVRTAIDSSMWVFVVNKKLLADAENNDFDAITHAINGGSIGNQDREAYYQRALAAMPEN